jgi:polysaccharide pyruvyl transferase WcaK-like protein
MTSARGSVLVLGGFGRGDAGAEARLDAVLAGLPGVDVVAASDDPDRTSSLHGCDAVAARTPVLVRAANRAAGVVVAGGDVFGAADQRRNTAVLLAARARSVPTVLLGVGVGPLGPARRRDGAVVRGSDLVLLRDVESASLLAGAGVPAPFRVAADPAWPSLAAPDPNRAGHDSRVVVVVDGSLGPRHAGELAASLAPLESEAALLPWRRDEDDRRFADAVGDACGADVLDPPTTLADVVDGVAGAQLVVSHRAHAAMAVAAAGRRLLAVGAAPELAGVARAVGQAHVPAHAAAPVLTRAVAAAATSGAADRAAVGRAVDRANDGMALARLVLGIGTDDADLGASVELHGETHAW